MPDGLQSGPSVCDRQYAIVSALLLLDAASDFSSMSPGAGKARPAHDRAAPLLDQGLSPLASLLKSGFAGVLWVLLVSRDLFSLLLLRTPPPVSPRLKSASVRPRTLRLGCSLLLDVVSWLASASRSSEYSRCVSLNFKNLISRRVLRQDVRHHVRGRHPPHLHCNVLRCALRVEHRLPFHERPVFCK